MSSENKYWPFILAVLLSLPIYIFFGYFIDRTNFALLFGGFTLLFLVYFLQIVKLDLPSTKWLIIFAIGIRLIFLFSEPALSDDVYRFIWDGRLWHAGINPFEHLPDYFINSDIHIVGIDENLYQRLNSKHYFSIYPPVNQLIFYLSTSYNVESLWISTLLIRISIILAEIITLFSIIKVLEVINLPNNRLALYAFNPLVIIELSGNLHFEAWLIAFLLLSILTLLKNRLFLSAVFMALAISSKLWPLMFLPLLFGKMKFADLVKYYGICLITILITFIPIMDFQLLNNLWSSVDLYFQKFEFNASLFYIAQYVGFQWKGYDLVQIIGPIFAGTNFIGILFIAWQTRLKPMTELPLFMLSAFCLYLFLGTTIHPWYLTLPLALSIFTPYRFTILWSFLVVLSYFAYSQPGWQESFVLLGIEYISVFLFLIYESRYGGKFSEKMA